MIKVIQETRNYEELLLGKEKHIFAFSEKITCSF